MNNTLDNEFLLVRNLKDAGCSPSLVAHFLALREEGKTRDLKRLLSRQRATLLEKVHANQIRIDCLDHLVYVMDNPKV